MTPQVTLFRTSEQEIRRRNLDIEQFPISAVESEQLPL
jgi:hypothetical protein